MHEPIQALVEEGDKLFDKGKFDSALAKYEAAYALLPSDKGRWEATTWVLAAIGDTCFHSGDYTRGEDALARAIECPGGIENPFLLLRLGQCVFELGRMEDARTVLGEAWDLAGDELFDDEDDKYLQLVKD